MTVDRRVILAALGAALALRLAFALAYWQGRPLTRDEHEYLDLAARVAGGYGLTYAEGSSDRFARAPAYPWFIAAVLRATGEADRTFDESPRTIKIVQCALGTVAVWLIALIAGRVAGARAAAAAAWIAAVYPPLVWIDAYVFSEAMYIPLALLSVWTLGGVVDRPSGAATAQRARALAAAAGVICGAAALTRSAHLLFVALATAWLAARRQAVLAIVFAVCTAAIVAPWTIRNIRVHHRLIVVAADGGVTFWTGNHPLAVGEGDMAANPQLKLADADFRREHPGLTTEDREPLYYRAAFSWIRSHPLEWVALVARKFLYIWIPVGPSYRLHSARYFAASVASYGILLPFGLAGAWRLRHKAVQPRALWLLALSAIVTALIFMPQERFRIPVIDPALIACAAALAAGPSGRASR